MTTAKEAKATEAKTAPDTAKDALANTTQKLSETTKATGNIFAALTDGSRKALEGVIEVDKALLGFAGEAVKSYVALGRESVSAKSVSDLFDLHVAHAHDRIEQSAANTREVLELVQAKAKESYEPIKSVVSAYLPEKEKVA